MKAVSLFFAVACLAACSPRELIIKRQTAALGSYFEGDPGQRLDAVRGPIYTYHDRWERNLIIDAGDGLVVIDPMTPRFAKGLKAALDARFPGKPVRTLIYSHYHLDHASGGSVLAPQEVIAHAGCEAYWKQMDASLVLPPTRAVTGDVTMRLGEAELRMIYLGRSHTDTLYAFYFPKQRVLFTADVGMVKTVPPLGWPDIYTPGYLAAMEKLAALDFDVFVPSHFQVGTKQDFIEHAAFLGFIRSRAHALFAKEGFNPDTEAIYRDVYLPAREKYGEWYGFDVFGLPTVLRHVTGEGLGF